MDRSPWTVRGIPSALVKKVKLEAKERDMTLGEAVKEALSSWLDNPPALSPEQERLVIVEERLEKMEQAVKEMQQKGE
jgi:hypothetical protein